MMRAIRIDRGFADLGKMEALAKEAFPQEEYLSSEELLQMSEQREVELWALYDAEAFVGFMVVSAFENLCYLFFLAIDAHIRSKGYGGQALRLLEELYPNRQQVVDFEMIDPSAPNHEQRIHRKAFYIRNGYRETGKFLSYRGVDYEILCREDAFDFEMFRRMMQHFHIDGFCPRYFER